ncbi:MAG: hypothetical protein WB555_11095, partial [Candidatus Korobacteraceae bacterium]
SLVNSRVRVSPGFEARECKVCHSASVPVITASRNHYFCAAGMPSGLERWHGGDDLHFITFSSDHWQPPGT